MLKFSKVLTHLFLLLIIIDVIEAQYCIAIDASENKQCSYCGYQYYVNDISLFATQNIFSLSTCAPKTNSNFAQNTYISSVTTCTTACDGTLANPYPNLYDAIISISFIASQYVSSQLNFYLLGSNHYITRNKIISGGAYLFKKLNSSISIQPYLCTTSNENGCFQSNDDGPTVFIKSDDLKFFITNSLMISQIVFDGSDGHLTTATDLNSCFNMEQSCCNETTITNEIFNTSNLKCAIKSFTLPTKENMQKKLGFFTLFYEFDVPLPKTPALLIKNCKFLNFYSFKEDPNGGLNSGISIFFGFYNNLPGILEVQNTTIKGGFYRFGMVQRTNENSITHNIVGLNDSTPKDLNATLTLKSSMIFNNLQILNYNSPKLIYQDVSNPFFGSLFYVNNIQNSFQLTNSILFLIYLKGGVIYIDPNLYVNTSSVILNGIQLLNTTGYSIMHLLNCVNYIFLNNTFKYNDVSKGYGFVIQNNPIFLFKNSTVEGPLLSSMQFFSIENSRFIITDSTFRNLYTTKTPYFFIQTTTKIYVASDTQFATSVASSVPYSNDTITIENSYFEYCNFLIFSNEHSVLYFTIRNSYFKHMSMNTTTAAISITCEREVLFDNMTLEELTHREHFVTLFAGRNFTLKNCKIFNSHLINFILLMVVIPLNYDLYPWVYCRLSNNNFSHINIIKNIENSSLTEIVQFFESQPISRGFGFHYILIENNTFEEILGTTLGADYLLYFASGHANMTDNYFSNIKMLEVVRFFPRTPNSILCIFRNKFSLKKYYFLHFFIITIGYYVDKLFIEDCMFEAEKTLNYSSGLEFLNIGLFSIKRSVIQNIQSLTGNALTVNTNSLKAFFVRDCYFYFNAGANNNGADIVLGVANIIPIEWNQLDFSNLVFGIINSTFDSAQASGSVTLMDNGEMLIYQSTFKNIIGDSGAVLNIGSSCRIYVSNIVIYNISSNDNGGCFQMMTSEFFFSYSIIEMAGTTQIGGVVIATESSTVYIESIVTNNTFSLKGGVISTEDSILVIINSNFGFSNSSSQGGHFYLKKSSVNFKNVNLTNGLSLTAGSIYGELVTMTLLDVRVVNCTCDRAKGLGTVHLIGSDDRSSLTNFLCQGNVAMTGSCIFAKDIELDIENCLFLDNVAVVNSIIEIFFSSLTTEIVVTNSKFLNNYAESSVLKSKITNVILYNTLFEGNSVGEALLLLDQVTLNVKNVIFNCSYNNILDVYIIYLTNSQNPPYAFVTNTSFLSNGYVGGIYCMNCEQLLLEDIEIKDSVGTYGAGIRARSTFVSLNHVIISNNSASQGGGGIYLEDSWVNLTGTIFKGNSISSNHAGPGADIYCNNAQIYKYSLYLLSLTNSNTSQMIGYSMYITYSDIFMVNFTFIGEPNLTSSGIECVNCININIVNTLFYQLINLSAIVINNNYKQTTYLYLTETDFKNCSSSEDGAFLNIIGDVYVLINYTLFYGGYAINRGGAVYYENSANFSKSYFRFNNVVFKSNTAIVNGGAIFTAYTLVGTEKNVSFEDNTANNGIDIYSYPSKLLIVTNTGEDIINLQDYVTNGSFLIDYLNETLNPHPTFDVKSGNPFSFGTLIIDDYNNVLDSETDTICEVKPLSINGSLAVDVENNLAKLSQGMAIFARVSIVETSNSLFHFYVVYSGNNDYQILNKTFDIFIQKCGRGEIFNENRCISCEDNFYSLEPNPEALSLSLSNKTLECTTCPGYAYCPGGEKIIPDDGYWRMNENTSKIVKCYPKESCPYQNVWVNQSNFTLFYQCGTGYSGNLCKNCAKGFGQYHTGCYSCSTNENYHYALYVFKFLFMIVLIVYETYGALKKEHSVSKCLIRIYLNHTIYLIAFTGLNLDLSDQFRVLFGQINSNLSIIPSDIFNFHCLLSSSTDEDSIFSANLAIQIILPLIYGSIGFFLKTILDILLYCWSPKIYKIPKLKRLRYNIVITFYLAYRNWYPRVLMSTMDLFKCLELGVADHEFLQSDPNIPCWKDQHKKILIATVLPSIIVWVILIPSLTLYYLKRNKKLLVKRNTYIQENLSRISKRKETTLKKFETEKEKIKSQGTISEKGESMGRIKKGESIFFYLTDDYESKYYLWTVIENGIAFSILLLSQVIAGLEDKIQRMIMFITFAILFLIYQKLEPFERKINNTIASFSVSIALLTIIFQMIGANESNNPSIMDFSVGMIIFCNIFFYVGGLIVVILYRHKDFRGKIYAIFKGVWRYLFSLFKR